MKKKEKQLPVRLAYLVSHPIQYQVPLLQQISQETALELKVFFRSDYSVKKHIDPEFGEEIQWDTNLLDGYDHEFLPAIGPKEHISFWRPFNFGLLKKLRVDKIQVLWVHGYSSLFNIISLVLAKLAGIKILLRDEATLISRKRSLINRAVKRIIYFWLNIFCDGFLAIGTLNQEYYLANGIPKEKIFLMPYAVDNAFFRNQAKQCDAELLRKKLSLIESRPIILFTGKLLDRKGVFELLQAFYLTVKKINPRPYLVLVGEGKLREKLEREVAKYNLEDDVIFTGFVNQKDLVCYYQLCNLFVLPSKIEPWGLVVNEVMNLGKAVITSDQVGNSKDLVSFGRNGIVYKSGDANGLANAIQETLSSSSKNEKMGKESLKIISRWSFKEDLIGLKTALDFVLDDREE